VSLVAKIILSLALLQPAFADDILPAKNDNRSHVQNDHATFEAVTGDSADEDKTAWDNLYKNKNFVFGKDPVSFLKDHLSEIPKGRAFVPAMAEGRNAIFLAKKGFTVDGNDLSDVAVDKALAEAKVQHVQIKAAASDLNTFRFPDNYYDLVVISLFYEKNLMFNFKKTVKKGGYILFYLRVLDENNKDKKLAYDDFAVSPAELKEEMKDFQTKIFSEYLDHGIKVMGLLARKP
jgi:tellurite methyltransferase